MSSARIHTSYLDTSKSTLLTFQSIDLYPSFIDFVSLPNPADNTLLRFIQTGIYSLKFNLPISNANSGNSNYLIVKLKTINTKYVVSVNPLNIDLANINKSILNNDIIIQINSPNTDIKIAFTTNNGVVHLGSQGSSSQYITINKIH